MISEAGFSERNILIASVSLTVGVGFTQVPTLLAHTPALFQQVFASNAIAGVFVIAFIMNLVLPRDEKFYKINLSVDKKDHADEEK